MDGQREHAGEAQSRVAFDEKQPNLEYSDGSRSRISGAWLYQIGRADDLPYDNKTYQYGSESANVLNNMRHNIF